MLLLGDLFSPADFIENALSQGIYLSAMQQTLYTISFLDFISKWLGGGFAMTL